MSIFAGIYSIDQGPTGRAPSARCMAAIREALSRRQDPVEVYSSNRFFIAKADFLAFEQAGFVRPDDGNPVTPVVALAGHPFLSATVEPNTRRDVQIRTISDALVRDDYSIMNECNGTYALCHFNSASATMVLCTDHVGSRPLYYHIGTHYVYFSTALRVLEALVAVPKRLDLQAAAEGIAFSYPLGDRTAYKDIKVLENGQYLVADRRGVQVRNYFRWDDIAPTASTPKELLDQAYDTFVTAIRHRLLDQPDVVALLSGGLDSRCIVTALHHLNSKVFAVTWASDGYLDGALATAYARALSLHHVVRTIPACPTWRDYARAMQSLRWSGTAQPQRPRLVFSGDGGSVGVGYDYLTEEHITWMRAGQRRKVVDYLMSRNVMPSRFLKANVDQSLRDAFRHGIESEFAAIHSHDPGRDLHIFYMKNDQRRHLHQFFEDNDISRIEYLLPFYDAAFLKLTMTGCVDNYLRHYFYHAWLDRFPSIIKSVAWQTYPGHLDCPIPLNVRATSQWNKRRADHFRGKNRQAFRQCARALFSQTFPSTYMKRTRLALALLFHGLRLRPYAYVFEACNYLHATCLKCDAGFADGEVAKAAPTCTRPS